jgi:LPS-assembly protein
MPDDRELNGKERYAYFLAHSQTLPQHGMSAQLNLNRVSDNTYFTDLATRIGLTSTVLLPNDVTLAKSGYWAGTRARTWSARSRSTGRRCSPIRRPR